LFVFPHETSEFFFPLLAAHEKPQNLNESFWENFHHSSKAGEDGISNGSSNCSVRKDAILLSILAGTPVKDFAPSNISKIVRRYVLIRISFKLIVSHLIL
jgi:hypothetical protein